jgi:hypothetical protein
MKKKVLKSSEEIAKNILKIAVIDFGDESQILNEELVKQYIIAESLEFEEYDGCFSEQIDTIYGNYDAGFSDQALKESVRLVENYIKEYQDRNEGE